MCHLQFATLLVQGKRLVKKVNKMIQLIVSEVKQKRQNKNHHQYVVTIYHQ